MKLFFRIAFIVVCISAQDQGCMDRCGEEADECHESCKWNKTCNFDEEYIKIDDESCHEGCRNTMCRCFKGCGCPECCGYQNSAAESNLPKVKSFSEETFDESGKSEVSQFLRKKSNFRK